MEELNLTATKRTVKGKRNRFLRREGQTPAHLFGHSIESVDLQCDTVALQHVIDKAGHTRLVSLKIEGEKDKKTVFVREIQHDVFHKNLVHVDFYQIRKDEKMAMNVPIVLVGESPALKGKGRLLMHGLTELSIECLPENVPPQIDIDISVLEDVEQAIHVKDIVLGADVTVHADPELMVVKIGEVALRAEAGEAAEGEEAGEAAEAGGEAETPSEETASE